MHPRFLIAAILLSLALPAFAADTNTLKNSRTGPFILGAEVSWAPEDEADGAEYFNHGVKQDIFAILKEYKFNYIRLRLFVDTGNGLLDRVLGAVREGGSDLDHVSLTQPSLEDVYSHLTGKELRE